MSRSPSRRSASSPTEGRGVPARARARALRPRARILRTLGDELISSETVAVIELVKNAYDADATLYLSGSTAHCYPVRVPLKSLTMVWA